MPVPKPKSGESQDDFISRCMSALADSDPDRPQKQRLAICFQTFRDAKKMDEDVVELEKCEDCDMDDWIGETDDLFEKALMIEKAQLSYGGKKALPDSAYAYIEPGCKKENGKTAQRCRHMPVKNAQGGWDKAHVRAALQALGGARSGKVPSYASKAKAKICAGARALGMKSEVCGTKGKTEKSFVVTELVKAFHDLSDEEQTSIISELKKALLE